MAQLKEHPQMFTKGKDIKQSVPEMYTAILFTANADCGNHLIKTGGAAEVLTAQTDNADALTEAVKRASHLFPCKEI